MRVLIVGCGYAGVPLGKRLLQQGHEVFGIRRSPSASAELESAGIQFIQADVSDLKSLASLPPNYDWVVNLVSSSKGGEADYRAAYVEGNRNLLFWLEEKPPRKFIYASSSSVYAQADGSTVTEESPAEGSSPTSQILLEAEKLVLDAALDQNFPGLVLRVAGIYGPGRGHLYQQFAINQARMLGDGSRLLNMIHLEDLTDIIILALEQGRAGEIYNVSDDHSPSEREFFQWLSARLSKPMPEEISLDKLPPRKRGLTSKRVSNQKMKEQFGYWFLHPTFREGYEKMIQQDFPNLPAPEFQKRG